MPRVGKNPNWNRFNLIIRKMTALFNMPDVAQPEFIARCYDWIEPFAEIWERLKSDEEYTSWLIYRGIGNTYSTSTGIKGIDFPHGLLNDRENRRKAAKKIRTNFQNDLAEEQLPYVISNIIAYLRSDKKDGFIVSYAKRVPDVNAQTMGKYVRAHLVPSLEMIEDPYERLAGILIYAQSGCIPLDVYRLETERLDRQASDLRFELSKMADREEQVTKGIYRSSECHELSDPRFCGTFYGYFRQYRNASGDEAYKGLVPFELRIESDADRGSNAVLTFNRYSPSGEAVPIRMSGKPMHGQQSIHIVLQADNGEDFVTMSYKWISINNGVLQLRHGVLITLDRAEKCPQVQRFVFFNQRIAKENEKYVDAFLRFSGNELMIADDNLSELSSQAMQFLKEYGSPISGYVIRAQQALMTAQGKKQNDSDIVKELLEIKQNSLSQLIINAKEEKPVSDFFRSMLARECTAEPGQ